MNKKIIQANKFAGSDGTVFSLSPIVKSVKLTKDIYSDIDFSTPFYGLTIDCEESYCNIWIKQNEYEVEVEKLVKKIDKKGLAKLQQQNEIIKQEGQNFQTEVRELCSNLSNFKTDRLITEFDKFIDTYTTLFARGAITFFYESILSDKLQSLIEAQTDKSPAKIIPRLISTDYETFIQKSQKRLLEIKQENSTQKQSELLDNYKKDFYFIKSGYSQAPQLSKQKILEDAQNVSREDIQDNTPSSKNKQNIALDDYTKTVVEILKLTKELRDRRKLINLIGSYGLFKFLEEVKKGSNINKELAKRAKHIEFEDLLKNSEQIEKDLADRTCVTMIYEEGMIDFLEYNVIDEKQEINRKQEKLSGTPAAPGKAEGEVKLVLSLNEFDKFEKGNILVTEMTKPDYVPIMKRASGIITQEGGLTSHAAVFAREHDIPTIVGVDNVTKILEDGDRVEVNANEGVIKKIN